MPTVESWVFSRDDEREDEELDEVSIFPGGLDGVEDPARRQRRQTLMLSGGIVAVALVLLGLFAYTGMEQRMDAEAQEPDLQEKYHPNPKFSTSEVWGNRTSLFCFMVVQPGQELELAKFQFKKRAGIFGCNHFAVYSQGPAEALDLGPNDDGTMEKTVPIPGPPALKGWQSCLGCKTKQPYIMNANVLMRAWEKAAKDGIAGQHAWIVKVDADSLLNAPRLVEQIKAHGKFDVPDLWPGRYFLNCRILNSMQGSVEVLSRQAFYNFVANKYKCYHSMDWYHMGEDVFVLACLKQLGVWSTWIDQMLHDQYCSFSGYPNCWRHNVAVFHPLKTLQAQGDCWWKIQEVEKKKRAAEAAAGAIEPPTLAPPPHPKVIHVSVSESEAAAKAAAEEAAAANAEAEQAAKVAKDAAAKAAEAAARLHAVEHSS